MEIVLFGYYEHEDENMWACYLQNEDITGICYLENEVSTWICLQPWDHAL